MRLIAAGQCPHQHVAVLHVEVDEEKEGDEDHQEGNCGALPETAHFVQGLPHQSHGCQVTTGTCRET